MADNKCQVIVSNRGKDKLVSDGYGFLFDHEGKNGQFYWFCDKSYKVDKIDGKRMKRRQCRKRLTTSKNSHGDHIAVLTPSKHTHDSLPGYEEIKSNLTKMKGKYLIF